MGVTTKNNIFPMSYNQKSLWMYNELYPESSNYNIVWGLEVKGCFQKDIFELALKKVYDKHEILRTIFSDNKQKPGQILTLEKNYNLEFVSFDSLRKAEHYLKYIIKEEQNKVFSLRKNKLSSFKFIEVNKEKVFLVFNFHHIIFDRWSYNIFLNDLFDTYNKITEDSEFQLNELPIQYIDYSIWQNQAIDNGDFDDQLLYWKNQLSDKPHELHLPLDYKKADIPTFNGKSIHFELSKDTLEALKAISQKCGVTLNMLLLSMFKLLLYKYTNEKDIFIATPTAGRNQEELEGLIGYFVNTLIIRTKIDENQTFPEFLKLVKRTCLDAYSNQDIPFDKVVETINPERSNQVNPIYQVMFSLQNTISSNINYGDIEVKKLDIEIEKTKNELSLFMEETSNSLNGEFQYNIDLFHEDTIIRMKDNFCNLVTKITQNPNFIVDDLELISTKENRVFRSSNDTYQIYKDDNILEIFKNNVKYNPNQIALQEEGQYITYQELDEKSNKIAQFLLDQHIDSNFYVGTFMPRSIDLFTAWLGILKAGGTYIPLDPENPETRTQYIIDDARIKLVLTNNHTINKKREFEHTESININDIYRNNNNFEVNELSPNQVACIIYTSGSTGAPKGVKVKAKGIKRLVVDPNYVQFRPGDSVGQISNLAFDAVTFEMWGALLNSCRLVIIDYETILSPHALKETINRNDITTMFMTVSLFNKLISYDGAIFEKMDTLIVGGEALSSEWIKKCLEEGPPNHLINGYGPTETTTFALTHEIKDIPSHHNIPIGKPISNTRAFILNENFKKQPIGVIGELFIGGDGVAEGYLNNPALTKENFVLNPFSQNEIIYKTGDLARYLPNGNIEYIGRKDKQVKLRGFRIELGEIENHLQNHSDIIDVKVIVHKDDNNQKYLTAYYISKKVIDDDVLYNHVKESLPTYMHPAAYAKLDAFPLTSNGKLDEKALSKIKATKVNKKVKAYVEPRTEMEELLYNIFKEVLGVEKISITDNFFEIGGHSLLAMQVISNIKDKVRREVSIKQLFACPSIEELAIELEKQKQNVDIIPNISSQFETHPLSSSQKQVWFLDKLKKENIAYNIPIAFKIKDKVDLHLLEQSINMLINRHKALRTVILEKDGIPCQKIMPKNYRKLEVINIESNLEKVINEEAWKPFDLENGPLFKFKIIQNTTEENILFLNFHHIIFDGESEKIFFKELKQIYNALQNKNSIELPDLEIQYTDFIYAEKEMLNSPLGEKQLNFWKEKLAGELPVLNLSPTTSRNIKTANFNGESKKLEIPNGLTQKLEVVCKKENVTLNMLLLSAFQVLLNRYTQEKDIIIGTPITKRTNKQLENMVGFLVNTTVIRSYINEDASFKEFLSQVKETTLNAYSNSDIPFERIVEEINPVRENGTHPIFQIFFSVEDSNQSESTSIEILNKTSKFDLSLDIKTGPYMQLEIQYNSDIFSLGFIEKFGDYYKNLLYSISENVNNKILDLQIHNHKNIERRSLEISNYKYLSDYIAEYTMSQGNNRAISAYDGDLNYKELQYYSNKIRDYLLSQYGTGFRFGVCMKKSKKLIPLILGILKSGCTFVPIDPNYPDERLNYVIKNSEVSLIFIDTSFNKNTNNHTVNVDDFWEVLINHNFAVQSDQKVDDNLAYIIYTSGTTGKPKGVKISYKNLNTAFPSWLENHKTYKTDNFIQMASIAFDVFIQDITRCFASGGHLILCEKEEALNPDQLFSVMEKYKINFGEFVPAILNNLIDFMNNTGKKLPHLKVVVSGSDVLHLEDVNKIRKVLGNKVHLINSYGVTEVTCDNFYFEIPPDYNKNIPIGIPHDHVITYILDENLNEVPKGAIGELYLGGESVSSGYYNKLNLTNEKYMELPYYSKEKTLFYNTGDLVIEDEHGYFSYIGRNDSQVNIRGLRIELNEVKNVLLQLETIENSIVTTKKDNNYNDFIVAYIVQKKEEYQKESYYKDYLSEHLPNYMVPSRVISIEKVPLNLNGKVDFQKLPLPNIEISYTVIEPSTIIEEHILTIWKDILKKEKISVDSDFFLLGGNSLSAIQIMSRVKKLLKIEIPLTILFDNPNIENMASYVEKKLLENIKDLSEEEIKTLFKN